ncbi:GtrA family protein [Lichenibacterium dinghuense]|uniref:GtrA family protein n=1 Tax=Lichenibacterium dinghuense TaxID=2895977 RepID=UPI001F185FEB|nr:GtrA family protein [Lichenibacterium sp. 6Y81]
MKLAAGEAGTLGRLVVTGGTAALLFTACAVALRAGAGLPPFAASALAYLVAFAFAYTTQRRWTFGGRHSHGHAFPRYLAAQAACLLLSAALAQVLGAVWGASPLVMACATSVAVSAVSFALSRFWVFADRGAAPEQRQAQPGAEGR